MNRELNQIKTWFMDELNMIPGVRAFQSCSNFVAVKIENADIQRIKEILKENGILIRLFEDKKEAVARIAISERTIMENTVNIIRENI